MQRRAWAAGGSAARLSGAEEPAAVAEGKQLQQHVFSAPFPPVRAGRAARCRQEPGWADK